MNCFALTSRPIRIVTTIIVSLFAPMVRADEVTDWNQIMNQAGHVANLTSSTTASRTAAIVEVSVFEAVNGIKQRYQPVHVQGQAPRGASARAAAVQAAYANLIRIYPAQASTLAAARSASLNAILSSTGTLNDRDRLQESVDDGIAWGQQVADEIWAWRSTDGFTPAPPPFLGGTAVGEWRPTPPTFASGAAPQFAYMTPWVIQSPSQFRPAGPPSLTSLTYAFDVIETEVMGSITSELRTADQTTAAQFWATSTPIYNWNGVAVLLSKQRKFTLLQNARLFAQLNLATADAAIAVWDAKYHYVFWRPITAITLADTDGNPLTVTDSTWTPLIVTPAHPEYPSAHSGFSSAAVTVLKDFFGEATSFVVTSDTSSVQRSFKNFNDALKEIENARIDGGIHFRTSCQDGRVVGTRVGEYVLANTAGRVPEQPGEDSGDK